MSETFDPHHKLFADILFKGGGVEFEKARQALQQGSLEVADTHFRHGSRQIAVALSLRYGCIIDNDGFISEPSRSQTIVPPTPRLLNRELPPPARPITDEQRQQIENILAKVTEILRRRT